jgi:hypothetical protein
LWHKQKWYCRVAECERKVFTEALPEEIPARARITTRARRAAAQSIGDHLRPVSGVAAEFGMDWRIAHDAFIAYADEVLPAGPPPVRVLGIDETRRGKGKYEIETSTGVKGVGRPVRHRSGRSGRHRRPVRAGQRTHIGCGDRLAQ